MIKRILSFHIILLIIFFLASCTNNTSERDSMQLTVSAAISLSDVLIELKDTFEQQNDHVEIIYNFGGSGTLAQQIQQGAPVDMFISANEQWMDQLQTEQLIVSESLTTIAYNELVFIGSNSEQADKPLEHYLTREDFSLAIGHPDTVPAGKYAKQILDHYNLYDSLREQIIFAKDVRQVLTYVETGNADYGFVYKSDLPDAENSHSLLTVDSNFHDAIAYPAAVIVQSDQQEIAHEFLEFLTSEVAINTFHTFGFSNGY